MAKAIDFRMGLICQLSFSWSPTCMYLTTISFECTSMDCKSPESSMLLLPHASKSRSYCRPCCTNVARRTHTNILFLYFSLQYLAYDH